MQIFSVVLHALTSVRRGSRGGGRAPTPGQGPIIHPWDGRTRAEGAGSLASRAERRDTGVS